MGLSRKAWIALAALVALAATALLVWRQAAWRHGDARAMLAELPPGGGFTVFVDARALRQSGILRRLAGEAGAEDEDYQRFVSATGFEYRRDLDAVLLRSDEGRRWLVVDARIDLGRLRRYFLAQGGRCVSELCSMQGSAPERQISWLRLRSGRLGVAVSPDPLAAAAFGGTAPPPGWQPPDTPVWLYFPGDAILAPPDAPAWLALAMEGLRGAGWMLWSAGPSGSDLQVRLEVACANAEAARGMAARWGGVLASLREAAAANGDRVSLPALLAEGRISARGDRVEGQWRVAWGRLEKLLP